MARPVCAWGFPNPSMTSLRAAETSASRPALRTIFLKRRDSSTEIIRASGKPRQFPAFPRRLDIRADAFLCPRYFRRLQAIFLEGVIIGRNFHRPQRDNFAFKHKSHVLAFRRLFEPVTQPAPAFCNCQSLHTLIIASLMPLARREGSPVE